MTKLPKILIVEDEAAMARALALKLRGSGFDVSLAANGKEALESLKKHEFDLVTLDLIMPEMDGFQVLETLKAKKNTIPVLILSNSSQKTDEAHAIELGARDFIVKSDSSMQDIVDEIRTILND